MIVSIFGTPQSGHYLAQLLDKDPKVSKIYHCHTSGHDKFYKGLTKYEAIPNGKIQKIVQAILSSDLIITMGLIAQLDQQLQNLIAKSKAVKLVPSYECSMLEDSKILSKKIFKDLNIRTPDYQVVDYDQLLNKFYNFKRPFVLKYDQDFRSGRQTLIVRDDNVEEIFLEIKTKGKTKLLNKQENKQFIVEEFIIGKEHSLHILCKGTDWCYLGSARDYKKEFDGDQGNNVTSMGCYSPAGSLSEDVTLYIDLLLKYLNDQRTPYHGIMYLGILRDHNDFDHILEVNTRPGNPEFITVLNNIEENIIDVLTATHLNKRQVQLKKQVSLNIQLHENRSIYDQPSTREIVLDPVDDITISYSNFFGFMPPCGITTNASSLDEAAERLYNYLKKQKIDLVYRKDIGRLL